MLEFMRQLQAGRTVHLAADMQAVGGVIMLQTCPIGFSREILSERLCHSLLPFKSTRPQAMDDNIDSRTRAARKRGISHASYFLVHGHFLTVVCAGCTHLQLPPCRVQTPQRLGQAPQLLPAPAKCEAHPSVSMLSGYEVMRCHGCISSKPV